MASRSKSPDVSQGRPSGDANRDPVGPFDRCDTVIGGGSAIDAKACIDSEDGCDHKACFYKTKKAASMRLAAFLSSRFIRPVDVVADFLHPVLPLLPAVAPHPPRVEAP